MSQQDWLCLAIGIGFFYLGTKVPDHRQTDDQNELRKDDK